MPKQQPEAALNGRIITAVRREFPRAYIRKLSAGNNRGIPDIIIQAPCRPKMVQTCVTLWVESKTDTGRVSTIQEIEHHVIECAGGVVLVARDVTSVLNWLHDAGASTEPLPKKARVT